MPKHFIGAIFSFASIALFAASPHASVADMQSSMPSSGGMGQTSTTQTSQQSGGTGGGGGGGGGQSMYQSHAAQIQQAFQQPLQAAQKSVNDASQNASKAFQQQQEDAVKSIQASTAKDTPIDDKIASTISTPPALDTTAMDKTVNGIVGDLTKMSGSAADSILKQGEMILQSDGVQMPKSRPTVAQQLGGNHLILDDNAQRNPASSDSSATAGMKTFGRGLLHNPPDGLNFQ